MVEGRFIAVSHRPSLRADGFSESYSGTELTGLRVGPLLLEVVRIHHFLADIPQALALVSNNLLSASIEIPEVIQIAHSHLVSLLDRCRRVGLLLFLVQQFNQFLQLLFFPGVLRWFVTFFDRHAVGDYFFPLLLLHIEPVVHWVLLPLDLCVEAAMEQFIKPLHVLLFDFDILLLLAHCFRVLLLELLIPLLMEFDFLRINGLLALLPLLQLPLPLLLHGAQHFLLECFGVDYVDWLLSLVLLHHARCHFQLVLFLLFLLLSFLLQFSQFLKSDTMDFLLLLLSLLPALLFSLLNTRLHLLYLFFMQLLHLFLLLLHVRYELSHLLALVGVFLPVALLAELHQPLVGGLAFLLQSGSLQVIHAVANVIDLVCQFLPDLLDLIIFLHLFNLVFVEFDVGEHAQLPLADFLEHIVLGGIGGLVQHVQQVLRGVIAVRQIHFLFKVAPQTSNILRNLISTSLVALCIVTSVACSKLWKMCYGTIDSAFA